jgi:hypothetical protein
VIVQEVSSRSAAADVHALAGECESDHIAQHVGPHEAARLCLCAAHGFVGTVLRFRLRSLRTVGMTDRLAAILLKHKAEAPYSPYDLVFPTPEGTRMEGSNLRSRVFTDTLTRAELRKTRIHDRGTRSPRCSSTKARTSSTCRRSSVNENRPDAFTAPDLR